MFGDVTFAQAPFASLGGNSYFRTVEETAAGSSVIDVESVRGGLMTESVVATATPSSSGNLLSATAAESATATAVQTVVSSVLAAIAQAASATAAPSASSSVSGSIAESATGTDAPTRVMLTSRSIAEAAAGTDSYVGSKVWYKTMEESATATGTQATSLAAVATVREIATALDTMSVIKTLHANVTGVQLYVNVGDALIWVVIDDSQDPNWQNIPT